MTTAPPDNRADHPDAPLGTAGPFRLERIIAQGGAGIVYRGVQEVPLRRVAAIKVLRDGVASRHIRQRFDAERQALAQMQHPNVEGIFDAGTTDDGLPWFAMPLIDGSPVTAHCDDEQLSLGERVRLFIDICAGVSHAHAKGIIHRDLKPGNVLVERSEFGATAKVIDFGIAKFREIDRPTDMTMTEHGAFLGTLAYASPEQASIGSAYADARSDVFSLGALLHELLCGLSHLTVDPSRARLNDLAAFEPTRMSARIAAMARTDPERLDRFALRRSTTPAALERSLRGDLDAIVMTALDPEPAMRYHTVDAFAEDLRRMLDGRPVEATPRTRWYLLSRFARRHRVETAAVAVAVAIILGALATVSWMLFRERALSAELERSLCLSSLAAADGAIARGELAGARTALELAPESTRAFEWNYRMRLADATASKAEPLESQVYGLSHSPDGKLVAATEGAGWAILDAESLAVLRHGRATEDPEAKAGYESWWAVWSPDGTRLAGGAVAGSVIVWDATTTEVIAARTRDDTTSIGAWVDDTTLALGSDGGEVTLIDASTLAVRATASARMPDRVIGIVHHEGGPVIVASTSALAAFDPTTLDPKWRIQSPGSTVGAAIDPSGQRIALSFRSARPVTIHSAADGALLATIPIAHDAWHAAWSPKGEILWTSGFDQRVLALDGATYELKESLGGAVGMVWSISSADEHRALTGEVAGIVRRWDLRETPGRERLALSEAPLARCAFSQDGQAAFVADARGGLWCVDLPTIAVRWESKQHQPVVALRMLEGRGLMLVKENGALVLLSPADGAVIEETAPGAYCSQAAIAHDGSFYAVVRGREVALVELPSGAVRWRSPLSGEQCDWLTAAPDGSTLLAAGFNTKPEFFECEDGRSHTIHKWGSAGGTHPAFSHDGTAIWSCTQESLSEAACQNIATGEGITEFAGLPSAAVSLTLAARSPRGAVGSRTGIIKVFEPGKPDDLLTLPGGGVKSVPVFAPDADRLLLLRIDGVLEVLDGSPVAR